MHLQTKAPAAAAECWPWTHARLYSSMQGAAYMQTSDSCGSTAPPDQDLCCLLACKLLGCLSKPGLLGPAAPDMLGPAAPRLLKPAALRGYWAPEAERRAGDQTPRPSLKQARLRHCRERRRQRRPTQKWAGTLHPAQCLWWAQPLQWHWPCTPGGPHAAQAGCCQSRPGSWQAGRAAAVDLNFVPWDCHLAALAQPVGRECLQAHDEAQAVEVVSLAVCCQHVSMCCSVRKGGMAAKDAAMLRVAEPFPTVSAGASW